MQPLEKSLRNKLERTVRDARDIAETAAKAVLEQLGVGEAAPFAHLSEEEKILRRKLRAHGRQLGDSLNGGKVQTMDRLIEEVAYEHWHRMLFARFLAENNLLMYPDPDNPVAVSLEECEDLAVDEGAKNGWELAARFAARMLPQIFRTDSPFFQLQFAADHQLPLEKLLVDLPQEVFTASDSLGWVYQFWQAKKKDEVNASEVKIGARELPAVTQLFTEPYMVAFLLDNSLGAWWVNKQCSMNNEQSAKAIEILKTAETEEELRKFFSRPGLPLEYLRFVKTTSPNLTPKSPLHECRGEKKLVTSRNFVAPEKLEMAKKFRKEPTDKEVEVWEWLRDRRMLDLKWRRQQIIEGFIADFYCAEHHLAIEIDGSVHDTEDAKAYDEARDAIFASKDIRTLRIKNHECTKENIQSVIEAFLSTPSPFMERGPGGEVWTPAAGTFDGWPKILKELKTLDPCCGSGHFLVAAFLMLVAMRMELEGLSAREAVDAVLRDNIHGLEIDKRCVELAAFALALTAWRYPDAGGYRSLSELNVACSGLAISAKKEDWLTLAGKNSKLRNTLDKLHHLFMDAPVLGSLLNPARLEADLYTADYAEAAALLNQALSQEQTDEQHEAGVVAQGLAKAAMLLAAKYHWVTTNVPYLARGKQSDVLKDFCENNYPAAKNDLATVFLDRCLELCDTGGTSSIVLPQNWLFLTSYKKFRENLLKNDSWHLIARLGPGAFETISGEVVKAILISISRSQKNDTYYFSESQVGNLTIAGLDVSELRTSSEKASQLIAAEISQVAQVKQLTNPDARIILGDDNVSELLEKWAESFQGIKTGDDNRFKRFVWEHNTFTRWRFSCGSPQNDSSNGYSYILDWLAEGKEFARFQGLKAYSRSGICLTNVGRITSFPYFGTPFTSEVTVVVPKIKTDILSALCAYVADVKFEEEIRRIDQNLAVSTAVVVKVPFDIDYWIKCAVEKYPNGLPKPYSDDPTQWIFHGYPPQSDDPLQVAAARLLGYRWPAELNSSMELSDEARALVKKSKELLSFSDDDGIVCIPPVRGESSAADRLLNLLAAAYGNAWSNDKLSELLNQSDHSGKTLETWLRDKFFLQHCKLFHHRPFIWHIWDGLRDGFAALVNYHKLDHKNLETLIYTYLGDWISRQKDDIKSGVDGAAEKLAAAEQLKKKLEQILEGEAPYDIFVRWKPIEKQPIGWNPDINDGVRLNIRPFMTAGILRFNKKPQVNITWDKDRGKDVESAPWHKVFKGDRINDHHLSLEEKQKALVKVK